MLLTKTKSGMTSPHHVEVSSPRLDTSLAAREADKAAAPNFTRSASLAVSGGEPSTPSSEADGAKMEGAGNASPDRAAQAGSAFINSERAATDFQPPAFLVKQQKPLRESEAA